jgi:hypothetical protein
VWLQGHLNNPRRREPPELFSNFFSSLPVITANMPGQRYQEIRTLEHAVKFKDYKKNNMNTGREKGRGNAEGKFLL